MNICVNNSPYSTKSASIQELLAELNVDTRGLAVAVEECVVARSAWAETPLKEGVSIVLIRATQGG